MIDEGGFGLHGLGEDEVEDAEEEGAGLNGLRLEAVLIDGAVMVVFDVVVVGVGGCQTAHGGANLFCFLNQEVDVGGVKGVGEDAAEVTIDEILKEGDIVGGVFCIGEEVEIGIASNEYVIDAGLGLDSCFSGHGTIASLMLVTVKDEHNG